ncbi:MAG TPA: M56 family metallopeptidase [Mucilaginibacter sp.]|nr:M56 family metallopeptidase [Mucilaginibacter sp.]
MNWLYYLLEANLYLILFYALYYLLLRRETWHQYNRVYLLGSSILAFIIPVLQLGFLKPVPTVVILQGSVFQSASIEPVTKTTPIVQHIWNTDDYILAIYLAIAACLLTSLIIKIVRLVILSRKGQIRDFGKWKVINTNMERGAFTFFNYLFVSADMATSDAVIAHELVHIRQKHTWDIIYLEIFRIINWFNPAAYLLQRSMKELHEFIADEANTHSKEQIDTYTDFLVANAYGAYEHQLTNNLFNQSLLKKRIMMLHQKRSGSSARLKYLLVLPLLGALLCASTLAFAKDYGWIDIAPKGALPGKIPNNIAKTKRLRVIQGSISAITDKISVRESKLKTSVYTVRNLTEADKQRLLKKYNIKVEIVDTDRPADPGEMSFPIMVHADARKMPPPPPAEAITNSNDNGVIKSKTGKAKNVLYQSSQVGGKTVTPLMIANGSKYIIPEMKPGQYLYTKATDSVVQYKPGNAFAIQKWGNEAKNGVIELFGHTSVQIIPGKNDTIGKTTDKIIRKHTDSIINETNGKIKGEIKSQIDKQIQQSTNKLPPAGWSRPEFRPLSVHLAKNVRYPAKEFHEKAAGNVVIEFAVNNDHKIDNIIVVNDVRSAFANEVVRAAKLFTDTINTSPGTYLLCVQLNVFNVKMTKSYLAPALDPFIRNKSNFVATVEVGSFFED